MCSFGISHAVQALLDPATVVISSAVQGKARAALWDRPLPSCSGRAGSGSREAAVLWWMLSLLCKWEQLWHLCPSVTLAGDVSSAHVCGCCGAPPWYRRAWRTSSQNRLLKEGAPKIPVVKGTMWRCFFSREGAGGSQWSPATCQGRENFLIDCRTIIVETWGEAASACLSAQIGINLPWLDSNMITSGIMSTTWKCSKLIWSVSNEERRWDAPPPLIYSSGFI